MQVKDGEAETDELFFLEGRIYSVDWSLRAGQLVAGIQRLRSKRLGYFGCRYLLFGMGFQQGNTVRINTVRLTNASIFSLSPKKNTTWYEHLVGQGN